MNILSLLLLSTYIQFAFPSFMQEKIFNKDFYEGQWDQYFKQGTSELPLSRASLSTVSFSARHFMLVGNDAQEMLRHLNQEEHAEGVIVSVDKNFDTESTCMYKFLPIGYKPWEEFLESEEGYIQALRKHFSQFPHIVSHTIVEGPVFDKNQRVAYCIIELQEKDGNLGIMAIAHKLGRYGMEEITWTCSKSYFMLHRHAFMKYLRAFEFKSGYRYEDYRIGDIFADPKQILRYFLSLVLNFVLGIVVFLGYKFFKWIKSKFSKS